MRLHRLRVEHVRGLAAAEVRLGPGVTIVEAPNESGKTSLFDAFELLLREKHATTKQVVKDLQPKGRDVGSLVEAELTVGGTHLTVRKRFNRDRCTELEIHAPTPRQLTGNDAHDELRRLLEQGTDLALLEALRFRQGRPLDSLALADSDLLTARLDASAGGTGETADDALHDRIVAEFEHYHTPTGQERRILKDADAAVADADATVAALEKTVAELRRSATRVDELDRERARLEQDVIELRPALDEHRRRMQRVATLRAELDGAQAMQRAATGDLERATHHLAARRDQVRTIADVERRLTGRETAARGSREALDGHQARLDELADAVDAAEQHEVRARDRLATARAVAELEARRDELWTLRERQRRIHDALEEAESAAAFLADHPMTSHQLTEILDAAEGLRLAEARLDGDAPSVRVEARRDVELTIDGRVVRLEAGASIDHAVPEGLQLAVGDLAHVEVRAGTSLAERRAEAVAAQRRLAEACAAADVPDAPAAEQLARTRADHERTIEHRDRVIARELDGTARQVIEDRIRRLQTQVEDLEDRLTGDDEQLTLVAGGSSVRLADLVAAEEDARARAASSRAQRTALETELRELRDTVTTAEVAAAHDRDELTAARRRLEHARAELTDDALAGAVSDAEKEVSRAQDAVDGAARELDELQPEHVELLADNAEQRLARTNDELASVRQELAAVRATIEVRGGQGVGEKLDAARAEQARLTDTVRSIRSRATAARTLKDAFDAARDAAYAAYREPLRERLVRAGRLVFGPDLDVELDEDLAIVRRTLHGVTLAFDQLSAGAREQLAILTALAAADLAGDDGVPLVLDDTLGHTDPARLERLGAVLGRVEGPQVVVLTCVGARFQTVGGADVVRLRDHVGA